MSPQISNLEQELNAWKAAHTEARKKVKPDFTKAITPVIAGTLGGATLGLILSKILKGVRTRAGVGTGALTGLIGGGTLGFYKAYDTPEMNRQLRRQGVTRDGLNLTFTPTAKGKYFHG